MVPLVRFKYIQKHKIGKGKEDCEARRKLDGIKRGSTFNRREKCEKRIMPKISRGQGGQSDQKFVGF